MYAILTTLWFFRTIKYVLFWLYLWQLKEYHIPRFIDHFHTEKGKQLVYSKLNYIKLFLLAGMFFLPSLFIYWFAFVVLIYLAEGALFARALYLKSYKKPVKTLKTRILVALSFAGLISYTFLVLPQFSENNQVFLMLFGDVFLPLGISVIVLLVQPFFVVARNNILAKAAAKAKDIKENTGMKVVAITGSYGKTSTKEFLATILRGKFNVLATREHQNSEMGIAKCIEDDLAKEYQVFIVEMGAYQKGGIKLLCNMVSPDIGVVAGINEQHLALFGSLENLLSAEGGRELAAALPQRGLLVLNGDNKYCLDLYKKANNTEKILYSVSKKIINPHIFADEISVEKDKISFMAINRAGQMAHFEVRVLGRQNVQNLLAAIAVAQKLGMSLDEISHAAREITARQAGMVTKKGRHGITLIDSSYSANPDGVMADLDYLNVYENKKVVVMPCLIELGKKSNEIHEKIGHKIAKVCSMAIITSKDKFNHIKKGAVQTGMDEKNIVLCEKPEEIQAMVTLFCKKGDAVLLEGRVPVKTIELLSE